MSDGAAWMGASLPRVIGVVWPARVDHPDVYPVFRPGPDRLCNEIWSDSQNLGSGPITGVRSGFPVAVGHGLDLAGAPPAVAGRGRRSDSPG
jgi:hypothetical protein